MKFRTSACVHFSTLIMAASVLFTFGCEKNPPPPPKGKEPHVNLINAGIHAKWDSGAFTHDLHLTNNSWAPRFDEVDITITLFRIDAVQEHVRRLWAHWNKGETKIVNVPAHPYQKIEIKGTAWAKDELSMGMSSDGKGARYRLDLSFLAGP